MRASILTIGAEASRSIARATAVADVVVAVEVPSTAAAALALLAGPSPGPCAVVVSEDPLVGPVAEFIDWAMRLWPHLPVVVVCAEASPLRWLHRPNLHRLAPDEAGRLAGIVGSLVDDRALVAH